jgi:cellulose synthase/poly-beta-1,6-N-acetylglucosamine synthase-like glycosyltransferase
MFPFNKTDLTCVAAAVGAYQLLLAGRFWRRLRCQALSRPEAYTPSVSVIVACKGMPRYFDQNILSLLDQDYGGDHEFVFVSPSFSDPAYRRLQILLKSRPKARTQLLHSDAVPVQCSEKILNLLFALKRASTSREILAFADCDVGVRRDWLRLLVAPLERPDTIAVSAPSIYAADTLNPLQVLQMAWMGTIACYMDFFGSIFGWSWAIRRKDFESAGVERAWTRSLTDDFVLNRLFKSTGKHIEWALTAMPVCTENPSLSEVLNPFVKGFKYFRAYDRPLWVAGGLEALGKLYLCLWFFRSGMPFRASLLSIVDAVTIFLIFESIRRYVPRAYESVHPVLRRCPALIAAVAPILLILRVWIFIVSLWSTKIRWGGYIYQIRSADDIRVLGTTS